MANCNWGNGECDVPATTTLVKSSGEVVQLCEEHRNRLIAVFKRIADGELFKNEEAETKANHWFVLNKIPI